MRDYAERVKALRHCAVSGRSGCAADCKYGKAHPFGYECMDYMFMDSADAIEELLAFAKFVAREAIDTGDNDGVSAEILCRKLNKLGLIETDGEFWMLPTPPKEAV